jgi:hypothetical protein
MNARIKTRNVFWPSHVRVGNEIVSIAEGWKAGRFTLECRGNVADGWCVYLVADQDHPMRAQQISPVFSREQGDTRQGMLDRAATLYGRRVPVSKLMHPNMECWIYPTVEAPAVVDERAQAIEAGTPDTLAIAKKCYARFLRTGDNEHSPVNAVAVYYDDLETVVVNFVVEYEGEVIELNETHQVKVSWAAEIAETARNEQAAQVEQPVYTVTGREWDAAKEKYEGLVDRDFATRAEADAYRAQVEALEWTSKEEPGQLVGLILDRNAAAIEADKAVGIIKTWHGWSHDVDGTPMNPQAPAVADEQPQAMTVEKARELAKNNFYYDSVSTVATMVAAYKTLAGSDHEADNAHAARLLADWPGLAAH